MRNHNTDSKNHNTDSPHSIFQRRSFFKTILAFTATLFASGTTQSFPKKRFKSKKGNLWGWGNNTFGQMGVGSSSSNLSPTQLNISSDWKQITTGNSSFFGIKKNGTLWSCGNNSNGKLGLNPPFPSNLSMPSQIGSLNQFIAVHSLYDHTAALTSDGKLWMWGANTSGQLGLNHSTLQSSPTLVPSSSGAWKNVVTGERHTLGIQSDGTLWSWGYNYYGQLGFVDFDKSSPTQIGTLNSWTKIAAGPSYSFGIQSNGTLWSWGYNFDGQLGLSHTDSASSPTQVGSLLTWTKITCGESHTMGIQSNGSLWVWGNNAYGQLGLGNTTSTSSPTQVGSLDNWIYIAAGKYNSFGIQSNGSLWSWGNEGHGNFPTTSSPVQILLSRKWISVSASKMAASTAYQFAIGLTDGS